MKDGNMFGSFSLKKGMKIMKGCKKIGEIDNKEIYLCEKPEKTDKIDEFREYLKKPEIKEYLHLLKKYIEEKRQRGYYLKETEEIRKLKETLENYENFPIIKEFVLKVIGIQGFLSEHPEFRGYLSDEEFSIINFVMDRVLDKLYGEKYWAVKRGWVLTR